ncbi:hypothetical protein DSO57_1038440 [Entomophthora muscae]|uniref:Uncharacterized protein n=1 Tax=Entomophthora muscae TaxID=34485 RepID=A0ACC2SYP6_9FUNG|nr:hypothetical protein DSO57_1038440 [Entomophthora muscae]
MLLYSSRFTVVHVKTASIFSSSCFKLFHSERSKSNTAIGKSLHVSFIHKNANSKLVKRLYWCDIRERKYKDRCFSSIATQSSVPEQGVNEEKIDSKPQETLPTASASSLPIYQKLKSGSLEDAWELYLLCREVPTFRLKWFEFNHFVGRFWAQDKKDHVLRLVMLFEDISKNDASLIKLYEYNIWLHCLKYLGRSDELEQLYVHMKARFGHPLHPDTYLSLILYYLKLDGGRAVKFFEILRLEGVSLSNLGLVVLEKVLIIYLDAGLFKDLQHLLDDIKKEFETILPSFYRVLVIKSIQSCKFKLADKYFKELLQFGIDAPSEFIWDILSSLHGTKASGEVVMHWQNNLNMLNYTPTISMVNLRTDLLLDSGPVEMSFLLDQINANNLLPDRRSCFILLRLALQKTSKESITKLLPVLFHKAFSTLYDVLEFIVLDAGCLKEFGLRLPSCWPSVNVQAFNMVFRRSIELEVEEGIIYDGLRAAQKHLQLDSKSYAILCGLYIRKGYLDEAELLKKWLEQQRRILPINFYTSLMMGYLRSNRNMHVWLLFKEMKGCGVSPTMYTYTMVAHSLANMQKWTDFDQLFKECISSTSTDLVRPAKLDAKLLHTFLARYANYGDTKKVLFFIQELEAKGIEVGLDLYAELIRAYSYHKDFYSCMSVYKSLKSKSIAIDTNFAMRLINASIQARSLSAGLDLIEDIRSSVYIPFEEIAFVLLQSGECTDDILSSLYQAALTADDLPLTKPRVLTQFLFTSLQINCTHILENLIPHFSQVTAPDDFLWEITFKSLLHIEAWDRAIEFYKLCCESYQSPLTPTFFQRVLNLLLKHMSACGAFTHVDSVLEMAKLPDVFALATLIKNCITLKGPDLASHYLKVFHERFNILPDNVVCSIFVAYYANPNSDSFNLDAAIFWFTNLPPGSRPALASHWYLAEAFASIGDHHTATNIRNARYDPSLLMLPNPGHVEGYK